MPWHFSVARTHRHWSCLSWTLILFKYVYTRHRLVLKALEPLGPSSPSRNLEKLCSYPVWKIRESVGSPGRTLLSSLPSTQYEYTYTSIPSIVWLYPSELTYWKCSPQSCVLIVFENGTLGRSVGQSGSAWGHSFTGVCLTRGSKSSLSYGVYK